MDNDLSSLKKTAVALLAGIISCTGNTGFDNWQMQNENGGKSYTVTIPCTVAGALPERK